MSPNLHKLESNAFHSRAERRWKALDSCVLDAPNAEAIDKHHAKAGIKCDWIHEVKAMRG